MASGLANRHPIVGNKLPSRKLRIDEKRISGKEDLDRVEVSGGGRSARRYHGFVMLPNCPHYPLLDHLIEGAL